MAEITFSEAVAIAKKLVITGGGAPGIIGNTDVFSPMHAVHYSSMVDGIRALRHDCAALIEAAETSWEAHEALRLGIAHELKLGRELPSEARAWLAAHLEGKKPSPPQPRGARADSTTATMIYVCMDALMRRGFKPTRNDEKAGGVEDSASDVIAAALLDLGRQPSSYAQVKRIWLALKPHIGEAVPRT